MWSTKARPVETSARPRPSRSILADSWVSRLLRVTRPFLFKSHLDGMLVRAQAFHLRQANRSVAQGFQVAAIQAEDARPLEEGVHTEGRGESRGAGCWQRVIGACRVVAKGDRCVSPHEHGPRVLHLGGDPTGIAGPDPHMLGRDVVRNVHRLLNVL